MKVVDHSDFFESLRAVTPEDPLRVIMSGCMLGQNCGVDGTDYGFGNAFSAFAELPTVCITGFCPEAYRLGTPRTWPDIHGGDGHAVLQDQARVLDQHGVDLTLPMIEGAHAMVAQARQIEAELCLLMDMSAACGTQVISLGSRFDKDRQYQLGRGVAAAALIEAGFWVLSQRDYQSLDKLMTHLDDNHEPAEGLLDHHQHPWTIDYFSNGEC